MSITKKEIRQFAESNLFAFAKLINPTYMYGDIHEDVFNLLQNCTSSRQLFLLPRGHLKSHCIAVWCTWMITKHPWETIVYISAGEDLAKNQLYAIKNMITSDTYRKYWPNILEEREGDREQWSAYSFNVDHPVRKERGIRDHTIIVKTVKSNFTGLHASILVYDDVVIPRNANTEAGILEVKKALSQCASILNIGGSIKAIGTRYSPKDAYADMCNATYRIWDASVKKFLPSQQPLWDVTEECVEDAGDGTGKFLWPRIQSPIDNNSYGYDVQSLEEIRADYFSKGEKSQYYCQYYNRANDETTNVINRNCFQYYDPRYLKVMGSTVYFRTRLLKVYAAMDIAWTNEEEKGGDAADFTAIAVIGIDEESFFYVLDLVRFKTSSFKKYYEEVISLSDKWGFRKITVETNAAGKLVAQEIETLSRKNGGNLSVDKKMNAGFNVKSKILRQYAIVNPKYELKSVFHRKDGLTSILEEEIVLEKPVHDDLVDALGLAMESAKPPSKKRRFVQEEKNIITNVRFGGRRGR